MCTPGISFCEDTKLWTCTKSGTDAALSSNCSGGTATNPLGCFTDGCPSGSAACCRNSKATCRWNLTSPALAGTFYATSSGVGVYQSPSSYCSAPSECVPLSDFTVALNPSGITACSVYEGISVRLKRPMKAPGEVITLPDARVSLGIGSLDATKTCATWTGTVTWNSEVPSWGVTLNATCAETGKSGIQLVGTFSGDL